MTLLKKRKDDLVSLREVICDVLRRVVAWGGAGGQPPPPPMFLPSFLPQKVKKKAHMKEHFMLSQSIETIIIMMSLLLGETFSVFKIQGPVQWVLQTQNLLLFNYIEVPKIFVLAPSF